MAAEIVIAVYRPKPGHDEALLALIRTHIPALRASALITDRPSILMRASDGTYLEIFEWKDAEASSRAHNDARVAPIWQAMAEHGEFIAPGTLSEFAQPFAHFAPVE